MADPTNPTAAPAPGATAAAPAKPAVSAPVTPAGADPAKPAPAAGAAPAKPDAAAGAEQPGARSKEWTGILSEKQKQLDLKKNLEAKGKELEERGKKLAGLEAVLQKAKGDPLGLLKELGLDFDAVAAAELKRAGVEGAAPSPGEKALAEKVEGIERKLTETEQAATKAQETNLQKQYEDWSAGVVQDVTAKKDKFPLVAAFGVGRAVALEIERVLVAENRMQTNDEAAQVIEARILGELEKAVKETPSLAPILRKVLGIAETPAEPERRRGAPSRGARPMAPFVKAAAAGAEPAPVAAQEPAKPVEKKAEKPTETSAHEPIGPKRAPSRSRDPDVDFLAWREQKRATRT